MRTQSSQAIAARVALVYAAAAAVWILVTGWFAVRLPQPWEGIFETVKGLGFVAITAILLFLTISRWTAAAAAEARNAAEARHRLLQVMDTAPVGMLMLDARTTVTYLNATAERLMGVSADDVVGQELDVLYGEQVSREFAASIGELLRTGSIDGLELPTATAERAPRPVIARSVEIEPGMPGSGWIVALADYTAAQSERQRSARLLEEYRFLTEMATLTYRVRDPRQLFERLCELAVDVGGFKGAWAMVAEPGSGRFAEAGSRGLGEAGVALVTKMTREAAEDELMREQLNGPQVIINNNLFGIEDSARSEAALEAGFGSYAAFGIAEGGKLRAAAALFAETPGFFGVEERRLIDTLRNELAIAFDRLRLDTLRLEAEEALAKSEDDYRQLFDSNPQPMWIRDWDTNRFLAVNDAALKKYGFPRERFLSMTPEDLQSSTGVAQIAAHLKRREWGTTDDGIWSHSDAHGREFPVHITTHAITWSGHRAELVMAQEVAQMR